MVVEIWIPVINPVTGKRVNLRAKYHDHLISAEDATELEAWFRSAPAQGDGHESGVEEPWA